MAGLSERRRKLLTSMMQDAVYEAAVAVLTKHGISGMTMDRVAEKAEMAKGSLYKYFSNKRALLQFVHENALRPIMRKGQEVLEADLPALDKLDLLLQTWFEYIDENRGLFRFFFMDDAVRALLKCEQESGHASAIEDMAKIIDQGIDETVFRRVDSKRVAVFLFGAIREVCERQVATDEAWSVTQSANDLTDLFFRGLGAGE